MRYRLLVGIVLGTVGLQFCMSVAAQTASATSTPAPSADQMIEQLKGPRTRSLRNLIVESQPASTASAAVVSGQHGATASVNAPAGPRPSLSLLIQFDFNSARVRPESQQALSNLAKALSSPELVESRFAVEGHTDAKGRAEYNLKLSQDRADAVRDYLLAQGIARNRLGSEGKGSNDLANKAEPYAAENRRVRIVNLD